MRATRARDSTPIRRSKAGGGWQLSGIDARRASASSASMRPWPHPTSTSVPRAGSMIDRQAPCDRADRRASLPRANSHAVMLVSDIAIGSAPCDSREARVGGPTPGAEVDGERGAAAEHRANDEAADDDVGAEAPRIDLADSFEIERVKAVATDPGADLQFGEDQQGRDDRIRDVRRDVHLQPVEAEAPTDGPAQKEVEAVERRTADEDAEPDRQRFARGTSTFGAKLPDDAAKAIGGTSHARARVTLPAATTRPSAVTSPSIL